MEASNRKIITVSFVLIAALVWIVSGLLLETAGATLGIVARAMDNDLFRHGLPMALAAVTFLVLQFKKDYVVFTDEVVTEIKKVVFPSRKDTTAMTIVVTIMLLISGFLLWLFDVLSGYGMSLLVR